VVPPGATVADADDGGEADRLRPSLVLRGCQPLVRVFAGEFFVDGVAADGGGLVRVTVNGENLLAPADEGVLRAYFARRLALDPGTNRFEIAATDRQGNRTAQQVTVIRMLPEHLDARYRLTVGVPPLIPAEAGPAGFRVKRRMEAELTREPVRFRLLERDEGWDYVLREQGLSLSDLADPAAALRIGKLLPAELLLMGTLFIEPKGVTVFRAPSRPRTARSCSPAMSTVPMRPTASTRPWPASCSRWGRDSRWSADRSGSARARSSC
jgi:hypothetical protein